MDTKPKHRHQEQLTQFDRLPDSGLVPVTVVAGLLSLNKATCWAHVKAGKMPAPVKIGGASRWRVGDLRAMLKRASQSET